MTFIFYDKVNPDNVWIVKGFDLKTAKLRTSISTDNIELLASLSNSELQVLRNCPKISLKANT